MKKGIQLTAAAALAVSALTPAAAFAAESSLQAGYYSDTFTSVAEFSAKSPSEKKAFFRTNMGKSNFIFVAGDQVYDFLGANSEKILNATTDAEAQKYSVTLSNYENTNDVVVSESGIEKAVEAGELKVESVSAINAKQVQVKFNNPVDKATAENVANYAVKPAGQTAVALHGTLANALSTKGYATAKLAEDNKTLTITLGEALTSQTPTVGWNMAQGDVFNLEYNLVTAAGATLVKGNESVKFADKVAPTFESATASAKTTTNTVTLKFSEPVDFGQATVSINGKYASLAAGNSLDTVIATFADSLTAGESYTAKILNIKDAAGNQISPNPVTTTFKVAADATAPVVTNVTVVRDNLIEVTFDKSMNASTVTAAGALKIVDANLNTTGITHTAATVKANTDNKTYQISVSALPFNVTGNFTGLVSVANTVQDAAGNAASASTTAVTVNRDTKAPTVVSSTYKKLSSYGKQSTPQGSIVVTFDESLSAGSHSNALVYDQDGAAVSTPFSGAVVNPDNDKELILPLTANITNTQKSFTVVLPSGTATDNSIDGNGSVAKTVTVDVSAGAVTGADTTAPTVAFGSVTPAVATAGATQAGNKIDVTFTEAITGSGIDVASVLDTNNYRLNGAPLPSGSYITQSTATVSSNNVTSATIHLPFASAAKSENYSLNINGVKDKAGNAVAPFIHETVALVDDVQPELLGAVINSDGTLSLTFSENVISAAAANLADLEFHLNGKKVDASSLAVADGAGADAGKYVVTINTLVEEADGSSITNDTLYIDVDGVSGYSATGGDILLSQTPDASTTTGNNYTAGTFNANNAVSLIIKTVATPTVIKDNSSIVNGGGTGNLLKGNTTISVK